MNNNKQITFRQIKTGHKTLKQLPENFYEKVLDLEISLNKSFNLTTLQELVTLYSVNLNKKIILDCD